MDGGMLGSPLVRRWRWMGGCLAHLWLEGGGGCLAQFFFFFFNFFFFFFFCLTLEASFHMLGKYALLNFYLL